jgi:tol-pal system protein YbgF
MQDLKRENAALRENNKLALERMEALAKQMEAERAEQRRVRDMMATNFELLEQSVSLSLAKTAGESPIVQPDKMNLPPPPLERKVSAMETETPAVAPRSVPPRPQPSPEVQTSRGGRNTSAVAPTAMPRPGRGATASGSAEASTASASDGGTVSALNTPRTVTMTTTAAAISPVGRRQTMDDPDLVPPANPRALKSHGAAKSLYEKGFRHFARKDFDQTILVYQDFLERFPEDNYSDNAQFWIGEAYFRQDRLAEAEMAYRQVLRNYEHRSTLEGYKTPDAIYRIGQAYLKRSDSQRARYYFSAAAERFPGTSAGRKAQHELATLVLKTAGADSSVSPGS